MGRGSSTACTPPRSRPIACANATRRRALPPVCRQGGRSQGPGNRHQPGSELAGDRGGARARRNAAGNRSAAHSAAGSAAPQGTRRGATEVRTQQRQRRESSPVPTVALVGYTNAGKSTLFNAITRAGVLESARMFATLDPKLSAIQLPSRRKVLLSDTVGFICDLPHTLVTSFRGNAGRSEESRSPRSRARRVEPHARRSTRRKWRRCSVNWTCSARRGSRS